jgi:type IV secretion system protein TrbL
MLTFWSRVADRLQQGVGPRTKGAAGCSSGTRKTSGITQRRLCSSALTSRLFDANSIAIANPMNRFTAFGLALLIFLFLAPLAHAQAGGSGFIDNISQQYSSSAQQWVKSIQGHAIPLFWTLATISAVWSFIQLALRQADLADLFGTAVRFLLSTLFFYWILQNGSTFAMDILKSTLQLANGATGNSVNAAAFANLGLQIFVSVSAKVSIWNPVVGVAAVIVAILILVALALIAVNLILVNCETYIMMAGGIILLAFGATEWTRDMSISYYRHLLAVGLKQLVTLLLAGIAFNILQSMNAAAGATGWGTNLEQLGMALASALILVMLVGKAPGAVAAMVGPGGASGGHGLGSLFAGMGAGATLGAMATGVGGAAMTGAKAVGGAVRAAVQKGQSLSRGN